MIEDSKDKPSLNKALQSVKHYLQNQNNNNNFVNEMDHKEIVKIKSKVSFIFKKNNQFIYYYYYYYISVKNVQMQSC